MSASGQMSHMARKTRSAPRRSSRKSCTSATRSRRGAPIEVPSPIKACSVCAAASAGAPPFDEARGEALLAVDVGFQADVIAHVPLEEYRKLARGRARGQALVQGLEQRVVLVARPVGLARDADRVPVVQQPAQLVGPALAPPVVTLRRAHPGGGMLAAESVGCGACRTRRAGLLPI